MRAILLIVPVLLIGLAKWPVLMIATFYLVGAAWLAFECWRAPIVDEQGAIITASSEKTNRGAPPGSGSKNVKLA
jgi:hypothetical protein